MAYDAELAATISALRTLKDRAEKAEAKLADWDHLLRASVPEEHKNCASPIGCVQSYIAELEAIRDE